MTTTTGKRASTPRKPGRVNGASASAADYRPEPGPAPEGGSDTKPPREPVADRDPSITTAAVGHPYGEREVFMWPPRKGGPPIILPHMSTVTITQKFFATIYRLNTLAQAQEYMILAGVPDDIRIAASQLGDDDEHDQAQMFKAWFAGASGPPGVELPGES